MGTQHVGKETEGGEVHQHQHHQLLYPQQQQAVEVPKGFGLSSSPPTPAPSLRQGGKKFQGEA
jgi:hypothetical protein